MLINIANTRNKDVAQKGVPFSSLGTISFNSTNGQELTIPTYDGSGQATHPDVIFFADKWNGYHYWMCFTPYYNSENMYENPSVVASNDGISWEEPPGISNPIVPALANNNSGDHHSDTSFYFEDGTLYMFWRTIFKPTDADNYETIYMKSSTDGVNWSSQTEIFTVGVNSPVYAHALSPKVIKNEDTYYMYTVNRVGDTGLDEDLTVQYRTSKSVNSGWSDPSNVTITGLPSSVYPWHVNVYRYYNTLIMIMAVRPHDDVFIFTSKNHDSFSNPLGTSPLFSISASGFDNKWLYQSSLVPTLINGTIGFDLYYSAFNSNNEWGIGSTQVEVI